MEVLGQLKNLTILNLIKNDIQTMREVSAFKNLELIALSENNIVSDSIIRELSTLPNLTSISFRRNPLVDLLRESHVKQLIISYLPHLISYNNDKKFCRKDCQLYILRHSFHQFFNTNGKDQFNYNYEEFCAWASEHFPVAFRLIDLYENPYPPLDKDKLNEVERDTLQRLKATQANFVEVLF